MLSITKKLIQFNYSSGNDIKYIVVHDTANTDRGADAEAHYRYFNGGDRQSSAHYFVDDKELLQLVEDFNASWHCGDGGRYGITNHNSIGVEICVNSNCDYKKAVSTAVDLVKFLMEKYNVPVDRVVRHYDASRKICPQSMSYNNWVKWWNFKNRIASGAPSQLVNNQDTTYGTVTASVLNVRSGAGTNYKIIGQLERSQKVRLDVKVGNWWSIYFGDHGGFVSADYINMEGKDHNGETE